MGIKSLAELKKWAEYRIKELEDAYDVVLGRVTELHGGKWSEQDYTDCDKIKAQIFELKRVLEKINELEASVRERIELFSHEKTSEEMCTLIDCEHLLSIKDDVPLCDKSGDDCNPFVCKLFHQRFCEKRLKELRRLLEGEKG